MEMYLIDGSPRKKWNTATILQNVHDGAKAANPGLKATTVSLYGYNYTGCISCFACKKIGGSSYGKCVVKDDIEPVMQAALRADIVVFGSPIYFGDITGMLRCFLERFLFPNFVYDAAHTSIAPRKLHSAFVYTMNCNEQLAAQFQYPQHLSPMEQFVGRTFGHAPLVQYVYDTYQFPDYSKYENTLFSPEKKKEVREKVFPVDCENAQAMGRKLVEAAG